VHDLSAMTSRQLARFLAEHAGQRMCVAYATHRDGTIRVRPEPRALGLVLVALGLAACTGYAKEIEHPDSGCRDASGYEIDCRMRGGADVLVVPEEVPLDGDVAPVEREELSWQEIVDSAEGVTRGTVSVPVVGLGREVAVEPAPVPVPSPEIVEQEYLVGRIEIEPGMREIGGLGSRDGARSFDERVERREMRRQARRDAREERRERRAARG